MISSSLHFYSRSLTALIIFVLAILCLAGCSSKNNDPQPLRIGTNLWPGYEPLYLARNLGYLDDTPIKLVEYPSSSEVIRAYRNGAIEAAALTMDEVLLLAESKLAPRIVLVMDISDGGDVVISHQQYHSMMDLAGKRIGAENTALGAYVLSRALSINNMNYQDIKLVPIEIDEHERAFLDNKVDAVVTFEPVSSKLVNAGGRIIFSSKQIPGEIVDVIVVRRDYLKKEPQVIKALQQRWFKALDYLNNQPQQAATIIAKRLDIQAEEFLNSLDGLLFPDQQENNRLLTGPQPTLKNSIALLYDTMLQQRILHQQFDYTKLIDSRSLE